MDRTVLSRWTATLAGGALLLLAWPAAAQDSTSYKITDSAVNAGGHPAGGIVLTSASYRVTLDAIGETVAGHLLSGASHGMEDGFVPGYRPPTEVQGLRLTDSQTLLWDAERSVGAYNLYRDLISNLAGFGYGLCQEGGITALTTTDSATPPPDGGYFYVVTAANRLDEEGPKGFSSTGGQRGNLSPCSLGEE